MGQSLRAVGRQQLADPIQRVLQRFAFGPHRFGQCEQRTQARTMAWASAKAAALSASLPATAAGSGRPQWLRMKSPNTTGQAPAAAASHTVITRSIGAASTNSSHDLLRSPHGHSFGLQLGQRERIDLAGGLAARTECAEAIAAPGAQGGFASTLRALLPVQRNRTLRVMEQLLEWRGSVWGQHLQAGAGRALRGRRARAAVVRQVLIKPFIASKLAR
jgi:hypothetical protein